ncbi:ribosome recycling factor [Durotheca rogersii]|uniref:ribosome recycling factor n=1 Tax=Durotheca rogersii TaxID=419775 RepID=UPI00222061D1|nr:ribosome recycling factor [Durotheca rogersii]KAI5864768.1 ribosome recycling factor [Durotheca rogersii]
MHRVTARAILRQGLARAELGKAPRASYGVVAAPTAARPATFVIPRAARSIAGARATTAAPFHTSAACRRRQKPLPRRAEEAEEDEDKGEEEGEGKDGAKHPAADPEEPLNFADVESRLLPVEARFRAGLRKLQSGGRFNPDAIGALRVAPDRKEPGRTYPLHELAQIVPRAGGRSISVLAHEASSVRAIMSAVQNSPDFNQQPQRAPDNELELLLRVEPDSPDDTLRRVRLLCNEWRDRVRAVRQRRDKLHATWRRTAVVGPDLKVTLDKELDRLISAEIAKVDVMESSTIKHIHSTK